MATPAGSSEVERILRLVHELRSARHFEPACDILLEALSEILREALPAEALLESGVVHVRSEATGYRALATKRWTDATHILAPSTSVWSAVALKGTCVALDLGTCRGTTLLGDEPLAIAPMVTAHDPSASVQAMLARDITHVVALPLRDGRGDLAGMACLEFVWPEGIAASWPAGSWRRDLQTLTELAAPIVLSLPVAAPTSMALETGDPLFPIAGEITRPLLRVLDVFTKQDETLLILGPTGAGKSRLAQWCHVHSPRNGKPFETANLLAVPENMQLAELFGWRKGAFTGAHADHDGLVASANGGTLFLDEIDKLSLGAQAGLLRLLETRRFSPLGHNRERVADVRFIVATNADLRALVRSGAFREDLYYRVNVLPVRLPSLAERKDELGAWASELLRRRHQQAARGEARFSSAALEHLSRAAWPEGLAWPGNLRQLDNVVRRAYAMAHATGKATPMGDVLVDLDDVKNALVSETFEPGAKATGLDEALRELSETIVDRAMDLRRHGKTLSLASLDVLRSAVLRTASERVGVKDAYLLFGADQLVQTRNQAAAYKREMAALEAFIEDLGD